MGGTPRSIAFWDLVVQSVSKHLDGWKGVLFTLGGRITRVQTCLASVPLYFLSLFRIPVVVAKLIEKVTRDILWYGVGEGGRDPLVRWELCCRPKTKCGIALGHLVQKNIALVGNWLWRFLQENNWDAEPSTHVAHRCPLEVHFQKNLLFFPSRYLQSGRWVSYTKLIFHDSGSE